PSPGATSIPTLVTTSTPTLEQTVQPSMFSAEVVSPSPSLESITTIAPANEPTPAVQLLPSSTPPEAAPAGETDRGTPAPSPTIRSGEFTADAPSTAAPSVLGANE
ncbi:unnamed protein product, partial [Ectocarpus sp. 8 AP-2014]